jgi:hypothetical protein
VDCPREAQEKSDQNGKLFERSEFFPFRFFSEHRRIRTIVGVAFFWLLFSGEARKVTRRQAKQGLTMTINLVGINL